MPLTARDLDDIRRIVRDELARALGSAAPTPPSERAEDDEDDAQSARLRQMAEDDIAQLRRKSAERAAQPIPNGPVVDRYDAARLLDVTEGTITSYIKRGLLTRRMVKGNLQLSRAEIDRLLATRPERRRSRRD